ncbi:Rv3654c family TadE-like protein [Propioniciclava sp.]|uniref:Rv3654c family TadE-like protein n=1 Tax=Propioniciclava sp. TaxID=2038686 RepID=UPI0026191C7B|nr:Rv3654c family TadE-like protein [Propioniciclava sp.]
MSRRGERGSGSLLAGIGLWALALLVLVLLGAASFALGGHKVAGAADLAAVAGAQAQVGGADACGAARSSAAANDVEVVSCGVTGDEVEFVVTVSVRLPVGFGPVREALTARANAGVVTGADP